MRSLASALTSPRRPIVCRLSDAAAARVEQGIRRRAGDPTYDAVPVVLEPHPVGDVLPVVDGPRSSVRLLPDATSAEPVADGAEGDPCTFEDWYAFRAERQARRAGGTVAAEQFVEGEVVPKQAMLIGLAAATFLAFLAGVAFRHAVTVLL